MISSDFLTRILCKCRDEYRLTPSQAHHYLIAKDALKHYSALDPSCPQSVENKSFIKEKRRIVADYELKEGVTLYVMSLLSRDEKYDFITTPYQFILNLDALIFFLGCENTEEIDFRDVKDQYDLLNPTLKDMLSQVHPKEKVSLLNQLSHFSSQEREHLGDFIENNFETSCPFIAIMAAFPHFKDQVDFINTSHDFWERLEQMPQPAIAIVLSFISQLSSSQCSQVIDATCEYLKFITLKERPFDASQLVDHVSSSLSPRDNT